MTTERIAITISEDGSRVVRKSLQDIGSTATKSADQVDFLRKALGYLGAALAIDKVRQYADAWATATGLIAIATKSTEEQVAVQERLFEVAQKTRTGFVDTVELYGRAARAGRDLGASQEQIIQFTEGVGKALAIQHTSTTQASGALLQLGQALGGGKIQAQEYNSLLDGAPVILQAVAKNLKGTGDTVSGLTKLVKDGKVTSKEFFDAFLKGSKDLDKDFAKSSATIGQGVTLIENSLIKFVGQLDHTIGLSAQLGKAAKFIADNMEQIGTIVLGVGAAVAVAFAPGYILAFASAVKNLFVLLNTNPFVAIAGAIAGLIIYFHQFGDQMNAGLDTLTSYNDIFRSFGEVGKAAFDTVYTAAVNLFTSIVSLADQSYAYINGSTNNAVTGWINSFHDFYADTGTGFAGVLRSIAKTLDAIGGLILGVVNVIGRSWSTLPDLFEIVFKRAGNTIIAAMETWINFVTEGINKLRSLVGAEPLELSKLVRFDVDPNAYAKYGANIMEGIDKGFEDQGQVLLKSLDGVLTRAQEMAKERHVLEGFNAPKQVDLTTKLGKPNTIVDTKEIDKARNALRSLLNQIDPMQAAYLDLAKAKEVLDNAVTHGLISQKQELAYQSALYEKYNDIFDPLGAVNRELDQQARLLGMSSKAREVETQALQIEQDLRSKGLVLSKEESAGIRERLVAMQQLNQVVAAQDQLIANSVQQREAFNVQLQAIQKNLADASTGFTSGDAAKALVGANQELFAGTKLAADANVATYAEMYRQIDELRKADFISDEEAQRLRMKVAIGAGEDRLKYTSEFFSTLAQLSKSGNSKLAEIGKAAAVVQATIDGVVAVQKALASAPPPYNYALAAAVGITAAANVATILSSGFQSGGYTGNGAVDQVAGVVHGREFVMNAAATAGNRPALEAMNRGEQVGGGGTQLNVTIEDYGTSKSYEVQQLSETDVRIIARDETQKHAPQAVASQLNNPNSAISKSVSRNVQGGGRRR